jgi:hypothetical protein
MRPRTGRRVMETAALVRPEGGKAAILALLRAERAEREAPPPTRTDAVPCEACGSPERWTWIDGREICRECLIHDRTPLIGPSANRCRGCGAFDRELSTRGLIQCARCGLMGVTEAQWEWLQEHAAIMEFSGGMSREEAERAALELLRDDHCCP